MPSRSKRIAAAALVALAAAAAACSLTTSLDGYTCSPETCTDAAPDTDGLGDGHMGDKHVIAQEAVNLANDVAAGAATLGLAADRTITAGDLLLVSRRCPRSRRPAVRASRAAHKRCASPIARTSWSSARAWSARASDGARGRHHRGAHARRRGRPGRPRPRRQRRGARSRRTRRAGRRQCGHVPRERSPRHRRRRSG